MSTPPTRDHVPNHHGHHPGFSGPSGLLAALSMITGREGDAALVTALTRLHASDHVVDIGCGPGTAARRAARLGAQVTAVDPAPVMRRVARWCGRWYRLWSGAPDRIAYCEGRAESLPVPTAGATVAWSIATVHHWPDLDAGLEEVQRVLAPGGRFVAVERRTHAGATGLASHGWTDEQASGFAARCRAASFADVGISSHTAGKRALVAVLATR